MSQARQLIENGPDDFDPKEMAMQDRIRHDHILSSLSERFKKALEQVADTHIFDELKKKGFDRSVAEHYVARTVLWMLVDKELQPGSPHEKRIYRAVKSYFPYGFH